MQPSDLVAKFLEQPNMEGCSLISYRDEHNLPTIGIGHLLTKSELMSGKISIAGMLVEYAHGISKQDAEVLCLQDVQVAVDAVNKWVCVDLDQGQFDALVLLTFNIGAGAFQHSTLVKLLNQGQYDQVPGQFRVWNKVEGIVRRGLVTRREKEILAWEGKWHA
jgi:lysozyme